MVSRTITATSTRELDELGAVTHDQWMDLDGINLFEGELTIPMRIAEDEPSSMSGGWWKRDSVYKRRRAMLKIANVIDYQIEDKAKIGGTDVNTITFDGQAVVIEGGMPVILSAQVSALAATMEISDEVVDSITLHDYAGGRLQSEGPPERLADGDTSSRE